MENQFILTPFFLDEGLPGLESLTAKDWWVNKPDLPSGTRQFRMSAIHNLLAEYVAGIVSANRRPVCVAGDCCAAIGVLAGLQQAGINPFLIWFDAHGDFNTPETTPSGFLGGMPLAMMVGKGDQTMPAAVGLKPLPEDQVILTDARDLDPGERLLLEGSRLVHLTEVAALQDYPLPPGPIYVHFDTDVVSLNESPAQNYPAAGGPPAALMHSVFKKLARSGQVIAASLSSWNPELDKEKTSENISMELLCTLIG